VKLAEPAPAIGSAIMETPKLTLRVELGSGRALGPGKIRLLEAIDKTGSISQAGRSLGMSYRRAWLLVDDMNNCFRDPAGRRSWGRRYRSRFKARTMLVTPSNSTRTVRPATAVTNHMKVRRREKAGRGRRGPRSTAGPGKQQQHF
jgi:molybdenum-dependent DNA-binding transcriptional regulator ModE